MSLTFVSSSSLRAVGYDGYHLCVQFHTSATIYTHYGVPYWVYGDLMSASSIGTYYNQHIRGRYR